MFNVVRNMQDLYICIYIYNIPETNIAPKDGCFSTLLSYWVSAYFQARLLLVSGRVVICVTPFTSKM